MIRHLPAALALSLSLAATAPRAADLAMPEGDPILTVTGAIAAHNAGDAAVFDLALLQSLPVTEFTTTTIWTDSAITFTGVSLADLLSALGAEGADIEATAINDYAVTIPGSDAVEGGPILAYLADGLPMSVRDKGPIWIVYPYDANQDYQSELIYSRSIWQLDRIAVAE